MTDDDTDAALAHQQELEHRRYLEETTLDIGEMMPSKWLKKEDVDPPKVLTITGFERVNLAREGQKEDLQWVMKFTNAKPLVMKPTNLQLAAAALGTRKTEQWTGKQIEAYFDPSVMYAGKMTGGIRLRAAQNGSSKPIATQPEDPNDDIPW